MAPNFNGLKRYHLNSRAIPWNGIEVMIITELCPWIPDYWKIRPPPNKAGELRAMTGLDGAQLGPPTSHDLELGCRR